MNMHPHTIDCLAFPASSSLRNPHFSVPACVYEWGQLNVSLPLTRTMPSGALVLQRVLHPGLPLKDELGGALCQTVLHARNCQTALYTTYMNVRHAIAKNASVTCAAFASVTTGTMGFRLIRAAVIAFQAIRGTTTSVAYYHDRVRVRREAYVLSILGCAPPRSRNRSEPVLCCGRRVVEMKSWTTRQASNLT